MSNYTDRRVSNTGVFNIEIVKGTDFLLIGRIQEKNQAFGSGGFEPVDVTSWSWVGKIKSAKDATLLADFTITIADQGTDTGVFYLALDNTETAAIGASTSGVYDVVATQSGEKKQVLRGTVKFSDSVSAL